MINDLQKNKGKINGRVKAWELNHIEALQSLCALLFREIESLKSLHQSITGEFIIGSEESLSKAVQQFETNLIQCALVRSKGKQTEAAKLLGIKLTTLNAKLKRYKIDAGDLQINI